jgi:hypothetical protein
VPLDLVSKENWYGGFYELSIEFGPRDDARLDAAIRACWADSGLDGCWTSRLVDRSQPRVEPSLESQQRHRDMVGVAAIPGFGSTLCCSFVFRYEDGEDGLDFCLPIGAMVAIDTRARSLYEWYAPDIPREDHSAPYAWRKVIDDFLVDIATRIARAAPFELGVIGFEVVSADLERKALEEPIEPRANFTLLVPDGRGEVVRIAHPYERPFPG